MHEPCLSGLVIWEIDRTDKPVLSIGDYPESNEFIVRIGKRIFLAGNLPSPFISQDSAEIIYLSKRSGSLLVGFLTKSSLNQAIYTKLLLLFKKPAGIFLCRPIE